jgi:hypothetical protein
LQFIWKPGIRKTDPKKAANFFVCGAIAGRCDRKMYFRILPDDRKEEVKIKK